MASLEVYLHMSRVAQLISRCMYELRIRQLNHDKSKLEEPEVSFFDSISGTLRDIPYGDAYMQALTIHKDILEHHYKQNRHHPEHFPNGINDMNLIDILEMLCDWYDSSSRTKDGSIKASIDFNKTRFGISNQLTQILHNTVEIFNTK